MRTGPLVTHRPSHVSNAVDVDQRKLWTRHWSARRYAPQQTRVCRRIYSSQSNPRAADRINGYYSRSGFPVTTIKSLRFLPYQRIVKPDESGLATRRRQIAPRAVFRRPAALPWVPVCVRENKTPEPSGNSKMARLPSVNTQF